MKRDISIFLIVLLFLIITLLRTASAQQKMTTQKYLHDRSFWVGLCLRHNQHKKSE